MSSVNCAFRFRLVLWVVSAFAGLLLWQVAGSTEYGRLLVSQPVLVFDYALEHAPFLMRSAAYTASESTAGLVAAIIFSLLFGLASIHFPSITSLAHPLLLVSQIVPFVCLAPLIILAFGPGPGGKLVLSAVMCFFPIVTSILVGIRHTPRPHLELMTLMKAPRQVVTRLVIVPFCLPYFFSGLRVAAPFAVIGAIVAEFNGAAWGIGKDIFIAAKRLEPEMMMLGILAGALLSGGLYATVIFAERRLGLWYQATKTL